MRYIIFIIYFLIAFAGLHYFYPWSIYFTNFDFGWWETMNSYLLLALIMAIISGLLVPLILKKYLVLPPKELRTTVINGIIIFFILTLMALLFGPITSIDIPGTWIEGIFFAEWKFLTFIIYIALPFTFITSFINTYFYGRL